MPLIRHGTVRHGAIVLTEPASLPDGTSVIVLADTSVAQGGITAAQSLEHFLALPFFGMWQGRQDIGDSAAWVRVERERWHQRVQGRG